MTNYLTLSSSQPNKTGQKTSYNNRVARKLDCHSLNIDPVTSGT